MKTARHRESVFFVASGNPKHGVAEPVSFVKSQVDSIRLTGWKVFLSIVDDRTSFRGVFRNLQRIRREIARDQPGIVHAQYGSMTAAVAYCAKGRVPLIVSFCGDDLLGTPNPGFLSRVRERCARAIGLVAAYRATAIIVKSRNLLDALPLRLRRKTMVLPNGVDLSWFRPLDKCEARIRLGWPREAPVILFNSSTSGNQSVKNISLARASVDLLSRSFPHATLQLMSGAGPDEVLWMLNAADCLLVTSLHEGSPNIVKEAMACNLPVVSVPCGDVAERLKETYPGKTCPYDDSALAQAMADVLIAGCRSNGRAQLILQGLSAATVAERLTKIYFSVQQGDSEIPELYKSACAE
ncbi:MAG: glycosyltransferase [Nitrospirae bacterium]|nr:glycosyltransferase [Nitrospirota bacterium]